MTTHPPLRPQRSYFGIAFDSAEIRDPDHRYVIFSSPRTGSNYICARLANVRDRFGVPLEYLNAGAIPTIAARLHAHTKDLDHYLEAVARVRTSRDGWFGIKIQPHQIFPFVQGDVTKLASFLASFDRVIFMNRHDKLGQAISGAIASAANIWYNFGSDPELDDARLLSLVPMIDKLISLYENEDGLMNVLAERLSGHSQMRIAYEEIHTGPDATFHRVLRYLGVDDVSTIEEEEIMKPTRKPPGGLAGRLRDAYLTLKK